MLVILRFLTDETPAKVLTLSRAQRYALRLQQMPLLRKVCRTATNEGRTVIFQQISPALFSLPFLHGLRSYIYLDWTRKLYEPIVNPKLSSSVTTALHSKVLKAVSGVLAFTGASEQSLIDDYKVSPERIFRIPMPFDVFGTAISQPNLNGPLKVLFVGGDFFRKGGDVVLRWFQGFKGCPIELTIITQTDLRLPPGVRLIRTIRSAVPKMSSPGTISLCYPRSMMHFLLLSGRRLVLVSVLLPQPTHSAQRKS